MLFNLITILAVLSFMGPSLAAPLPAGSSSVLTRSAESSKVIVHHDASFRHVSSARVGHAAALSRRDGLGDIFGAILNPIKAIIKPFVDPIKAIVSPFVTPFMEPIRAMVGVAENLPIIGGMVKTAVGLTAIVPGLMPFNMITGGLQPLEPEQVQAIAPSAADEMCKLTGGGTGAFKPEVLKAYKTQWKGGMSQLTLVNARAQICGTANLSDKEVAFFTKALTNPKIIAPLEGAFTATEEKQYQDFLPKASEADKQGILGSLSTIPNITAREIKLIKDACAGKKPTILPDDGASEDADAEADDDEE